jgi:hypothetical protein
MSSKFIIKLIIFLVTLGLSIAAFIVDKLFKVSFLIEINEPQTNSSGKLNISLLFQREQLQLELEFLSEDIANRTELPAHIQLVKVIIPYNKFNDTTFMTNTVMNGLNPVFEELDRRINGFNETQAENAIRQQINAFFTQNKKILDMLAYYAQLFTYGIIGVFVVIIFITLYLFMLFKMFLITLLFFLVILVMCVVFTAIVFIAPNKIKELNEGFSLKIEQSILFTLINTYLMMLLFLIHVFMINDSKKKSKKGRK